MEVHTIISCFITSFLATLLLIPPLILLARKKKLFDHPGDRKAHHRAIPALAGIAVFAGIILSILLWIPFTGALDKLQYILASATILFIISVKDDIDPISSSKKLLGQFLAAMILAHFAELRLTSIYGLFGIYDIPLIAQYVLSVFFYLLIINAFNFIDGIDGLLASVTLVIMCTYGIWFYNAGIFGLSYICATYVGAMLAFLKFNITPAKIFMGDSGAIVIGMFVAVLTVFFIEYPTQHQVTGLFGMPAVAIGILILPLLDTIRVVTLRILNGDSPMSADNRHIHHVLIDQGLSHIKATAVLIAINLLFILGVFLFHSAGSFTLLLTLTMVSILFLGIVYLLANRKLSS